MRELYRFKEAADVFLGGDIEGLRQAIEFRGLRPLLKFTGRGTLQDDEEGAPVAGRSRIARWFGINADDATHGLSGYFYVSDGLALRMIERDWEPGSNIYLYTSSDCNPWEAFSVWPDAEDIGHSDFWFHADDLRKLVADAAAPPVSNESQELSTRERTTLYRVIAALAKQANIDIGKNKGGASVIEAAVRELYPDDHPKERTIREILAGIRNL